MPLKPDVLLGIQLDAICSRHQFTRDPGPVIDELRASAGERTDVLHRTAGSWIGFNESEYTRPLADALRVAFPECEPWIAGGRSRRARPVHTTDGF